MLSSGRIGGMAGILGLAVMLTAAVGCADPEDRPASFGYIHATVIAPACATSNCHSDLTATAGLRFDTIEGAYTAITGIVCDGAHPAGEPPGNLVRPGQPESSQLVLQLRGIERKRMPPDTPLPESDIRLIEQWILEGAECN
jgi:hypothetical protein